MNLKGLFLVSKVLTTSVSKFQANDHVCIDDTKFMHFVSPVKFFVKSCPPGFCFTRSPPSKNPCIGKEATIKIDGETCSCQSNL